MKRTSCLVALLLLAFVLTPSGMAEESDTQVGVNNNSPHVTYMDGPSQTAPVAGGTRAVNISIEVFEPNGWHDIQRVEITVFSPDNETMHRQFDAQATGDGSGPRRGYHAEISMDFWDAPGWYTVKAVATDHPGARSDPAYHEFHYNALSAMQLSAQEFQFPATDPGETSTPVTVEVRNVGNVPLGLQVAGTPLIDSRGHQIPESHVRASPSSDVGTHGAPLSQSPAPLQGFELQPGPDSRQDTWWTLSVPTGKNGYVPAGQYAGAIQLETVALPSS
jgi:hypothetical protein